MIREVVDGDEADDGHTGLAPPQSVRQRTTEQGKLSGTQGKPVNEQKE